MKKSQSLSHQIQPQTEKKPLKQFVSKSHQRSASIGRNLNKLNRNMSTDDISSNSRPGMNRSKSSDGLHHVSSNRKSRSFTKLTSLTSLQPLARTRSHQLMPSMKRSGSSQTVVLDLRNDEDSSDEDVGLERRNTNLEVDDVPEEEVDDFTDEENGDGGQQLMLNGLITRSNLQNDNNFIPQALSQEHLEAEGSDNIGSNRNNSTVTDNTAQFNEIEKRRNSIKSLNATQQLQPADIDSCETEQLEHNINELNLTDDSTMHQNQHKINDVITPQLPKQNENEFNTKVSSNPEPDNSNQQQSNPPPTTGSSDYYHDMILSQSTGLVRKFGDQQFKNSLMQLNKLKHNNDDSIQYIHSVDNINHHPAPANSVASSSNSLKQFTIQPTSQNISTSASTDSNSLLYFRAENGMLNLKSANNLSRQQQYANQFPNSSSVQSNNNNNFSSTPTASSNFNFNQFLKNNDTAASSSNIETRTQQKLWLQRENSLLDITGVNGSDNDINNPIIRREFERISREFLTVKRFSNPLSDGVKRTHISHINGKNQSRTTTDKLHSFKSDQIQAKLKKLWIEGESLSKKPSIQQHMNMQNNFKNGHNSTSPEYLHMSQQQHMNINHNQQQYIQQQYQQQSQRQQQMYKQQHPTTRAVDRSGNGITTQRKSSNKLDLAAIRG